MSSIDGALAPIPTGLSEGSQSGGDLIASGIKKPDGIVKKTPITSTY
ncbi:hypothetical protein [Bradyrhizobium tropiciagri]|nr:hypothetical protein [Bradyrhizobium tropiciagri]